MTVESIPPFQISGKIMYGGLLCNLLVSDTDIVHGIEMSARIPGEC
jgi:hypothetical protein